VFDVSECFFLYLNDLVIALIRYIRVCNTVVVMEFTVV